MDKCSYVEGCNFATALRRWAAPQQSPNKANFVFLLLARQSLCKPSFALVRASVRLCIRLAPSLHSKNETQKGTGNGNEKKFLSSCKIWALLTSYRYRK